MLCPLVKPTCLALEENAGLFLSEQIKYMVGLFDFEVRNMPAASFSIGPIQYAELPYGLLQYINNGEDYCSITHIINNRITSSSTIRTYNNTFIYEQFPNARIKCIQDVTSNTSETLCHGSNFMCPQLSFTTLEKVNLVGERLFHKYQTHWLESLDNSLLPKQTLADFLWLSSIGEKYKKCIYKVEGDSDFLTAIACFGIPFAIMVTIIR